jgi:hypothetical protein
MNDLHNRSSPVALLKNDLTRFKKEKKLFIGSCSGQWK